MKSDSQYPTVQCKILHKVGREGKVHCGIIKSKPNLQVALSQQFLVESDLISHHAMQSFNTNWDKIFLC